MSSSLLEDFKAKLLMLENQLQDPSITKDNKRLASVSKDYKKVKETLDLMERLHKKKRQLADTKEIIENEDDRELVELAASEKTELETEIETIKRKLLNLLIPQDPDADKNVFMEIRAGTGGDEACLFVADIFRMYSRFAERKGFKIELMSLSKNEGGGLKEVIAKLSGRGVYEWLKYEGGVHRVQRIPETEAQGRIHTSAITVAVLPEAEEVDVKIDPKDIRVDVFRSSGHGGQSVNTTDSAVRITHIPTGIVVTCQDERSQHQNRQKAMAILRARLYELEKKKKEKEEEEKRRDMVRSGDRSEKIRTYNFPQNRITDHRVQLTVYSLDRIIDGEIDEFLSELKLRMSGDISKLVEEIEEI